MTLLHIHALIKYKALLHCKKIHKYDKKEVQETNSNKRGKRKSDDTVDDTDSLANQMTQTKAKKNPLLVMEIVMPEAPVDSSSKSSSETSSSSLSSSSSGEENTEVKQTSGKGTLCSTTKHNKGTAKLEKMLLIT